MWVAIFHPVKIYGYASTRCTHASHTSGEVPRRCTLLLHHVLLVLCAALEFFFYTTVSSFI